MVKAINALFFRKDTLRDSSLQRDGNSALLNSLNIPSTSFKVPPLLHHGTLILPMVFRQEHILEFLIFTDRQPEVTSSYRRLIFNVRLKITLQTLIIRHILYL